MGEILMEDNNNIKRFPSELNTSEGESSIDIDHEKGTITLAPGTYDFSHSEGQTVIEEQVTLNLGEVTDPNDFKAVINKLNKASEKLSKESKKLEAAINGSMKQLDIQDKKAIKKYL